MKAYSEYSEVNKIVKRNIRADKLKYVEDLSMATEKVAREGNMRQRYDTTKKQAGKYSELERPVKEKEGKPITKIQEQRDR